MPSDYPNNVMCINFHNHNNMVSEKEWGIRSLSPMEYRSLEKIDFQKYTVGIHPLQIKSCDYDPDLNIVKEALADKDVIAIGETGLDNTSKVHINLQEEIFLKHADLADEFNVPLIIHCTGAINKVVEIRKLGNYNSPWIIHGYNCGSGMVPELLKLNCYFSFGSKLFRPSEDYLKAFNLVPDEFLFLETDDSLYSIEDIYNEAALCKGLTLAKLKEQIIENYFRLFSTKSD